MKLQNVDLTRSFLHKMVGLKDKASDGEENSDVIESIILNQKTGQKRKTLFSTH